MSKALDLLLSLTSSRKAKPEAESAFDTRLRELGGVRHVTVARAVLFRTRPEHQEA